MNIKLVLGVATMMFSLNACGAPLVNMKVNVHEDDGKPVEGANVKGSFFQDQVVNQLITDSHRGITDSEGVVNLSGHEDIYVDLKANKDGYYVSKQRVVVRGDREQDVSVLLRPKRNPISMYAKKITNVSPDYDKKKITQVNEAGYDLVVGDYVMPHGKGIVKDLIIRTESTRRAWDNIDMSRSITFSNNLDGLLPYYFKQGTSDFKGPYLAPEEGYKNNWLQEFVRRTNVADKGNIDKNRNYFFRIRTEIDEKGNIVSSYYGKIHGDFPLFTYYVNPTINDRNVEFNPKKNLFKNLKYDEKVSTP